MTPRPTVDELEARVRGGIGIWREDETLRVRSEQALAALSDLTARAKEAEAAIECELRYTHGEGTKARLRAVLERSTP